VQGSQQLQSVISSSAQRLTGAAADYDPLLELIGDCRFVLLGEASHGTHEFYLERANITRRLITEKGFHAVAVEADWPDAFRINRFVRGQGTDQTATDALSDFQRFPAWMWRNTEVRDFVTWLRHHNSVQSPSARTGFYGLDLYSLFTSIEAVLGYLEETDPEAANRARYRYGCFEHFGEDSQAYGYSATFDLAQSCEDEVVRQLVEMRELAARKRVSDGADAEELFAAEQNARLVLNAERYYRSMFAGRASSWNLRDTHMAETVDAIASHLRSQGQSPKIVVWAHNSHLGDARATEMGRGGELNVGQLLRQKYREEAVLVGFTTNSGSVTAADDWDGEGIRKTVRPGMRGSYEELFSQVGVDRFLITLRNNEELRKALPSRLLERAIGVIYRPQTERISHYFQANLAEQFDAVIHIDRTRALEPLEPSHGWHHPEPPETFPSGL
jgi:erythromycin esterase-like protein